MSRLTVGVAQAAAPPLDAAAGAAIAAELIRQAGRDGVRLLGFGEGFLGGGYPFWCDAGRYSSWGDPCAERLHAALLDAALVLPGPGLDEVCAAAREARCAVVIGANERVGGSLCNSLLFIDEQGQLLAVHRKLVPTHGERLVHARGDAQALRAHRLAGLRVGGLICWEHWMPLPRHVLHACDEQLHVASWPGIRETYHLAARHYAFEGRVHVLSAGLLAHLDDLPPALDPFRDGLAEHASDGWLMQGGSAILGPDAGEIVPQRPREAGVIAAEIDLARSAELRQTLDVAGHYSRPDLFDLRVRRARLQPFTDA